MKSNAIHTLRILLGLALGIALTAGVTRAQQPSPSPKTSADKTSSTTPNGNGNGDSLGDYSVISSIEFGYRGIRVDGDENKYRSDLNYKAGPRVFDSSLLLRSQEGKGGPFDTLMVTSTGWGADPYGQMRISVENSKWYRFDGSYRTFKYFNFLNNLANPQTATVPPNLVTGRHGYNVQQKLGDFDLTILPKNEKLKLNIGFSPERYSGPAYTTYHAGRGEFYLLSETKSRASDWRVGADGKLGPIDFSFLQGFRRFRDDTFIDTTGLNRSYLPGASNVAALTSFQRLQPARGRVNYSRFSGHTLVAKRLDMSARIVYSSTTADSGFVENITGINWGGLPGTAYAVPNTLNSGLYSFLGNSKRPNTLGDFGVTYLATDKLRISNTFRVETFQINGGNSYTSRFLVTKNGAALPPLVTFPAISDYEVTKYRKFQNTVEGDYQFNNRYAMHFGYRYGSRHIEKFASGFDLGGYTNPTAPFTPEDEVEDNHTNAFFGGFKARPLKNLNLYFDAEHGTADNVFTRVGNYDYTNVRMKARYAPTRKLSFNLAFIGKNNSNPGEIDGVSLADFGVNIRSRVFTSSFDWQAHNRLSVSAGYNYNWLNSDAVVEYSFNSPSNAFIRGHSLYFMRNQFFFIDVVAQLHRRVTLFTSYRINDDNGQGARRSDPSGILATLVTSYPMSFQSPEARLAIRINRRLDWNLGYQYYNYNESFLVGPRPQNYHAHLPYMSLRIYFGQRG